MNKLLPLLLLCFCTTKALSQVVYPYQEIPLQKPADYKDAEPLALSAASFLLTTPFKKNDVNRERASVFLTTWMAGTKDYKFDVLDVMAEFADDHDLFALLTAAMAKFCMENKTVASNIRLVSLGTTKMVLAYCDNPDNNFKLKKKTRKRLEEN